MQEDQRSGNAQHHAVAMHVPAQAPAGGALLCAVNVVRQRFL